MKTKLTILVTSAILSLSNINATFNLRDTKQLSLLLNNKSLNNLLNQRLRSYSKNGKKLELRFRNRDFFKLLIKNQKQLVEIQKMNLECNIEAIKRLNTICNSRFITNLWLFLILLKCGNIYFYNKEIRKEMEGFVNLNKMNNINASSINS